MTAMMIHRCSLLSLFVLNLGIGGLHAFSGQPPNEPSPPFSYLGNNGATKSSNEALSSRLSKVSPKNEDSTEKVTAAASSSKNNKTPAPMDWTAYAQSLTREQLNDEVTSFAKSSSFGNTFLSDYSNPVSKTSNGQQKSEASETSNNGSQGKWSSSGSSYTYSGPRNGDSEKSSPPAMSKASSQASSESDDPDTMSSTFSYLDSLGGGKNLVEAASNMIKATVTGLIKGEPSELSSGTTDSMASASESQVPNNGSLENLKSNISPSSFATGNSPEVGSNDASEIGDDGLPYFFATMKEDGEREEQTSMQGVSRTNVVPTTSAFDLPEETMLKSVDANRAPSAANGSNRFATMAATTTRQESPAFVRNDSRSQVVASASAGSTNSANRVARRIMHSSQYNKKAGFSDEPNPLSAQPPTQRGPDPRNLGSPQSNGPEANLMTRKTQPVLVQGLSLKTWAFMTSMVQSVLIVLNTEGRPLNADVELWQGPDNTPQKMRVYTEDGSLRTFRAVMATPRGPNTIGIRNTGDLAFPLAAQVMADVISEEPLTSRSGYSLSALQSSGSEVPRAIQGGALRLFPFDPNVESVQVLLQTDGRPLNARVELLQGPNNIKQVIDLYIEDGRDRPFYCIIDTPGTGNVIRVVNKSPVEFPLTAWVAPNVVVSKESPLEPVLGGDSDNFLWGREL